jgi:hypothetical protein
MEPGNETSTIVHFDPQDTFAQEEKQEAEERLVTGGRKSHTFGG